MISATLMNVLIAYYQCDYLASQTMLDYNTAQECFALYSEAKREITGLDPNHPDTHIDAYLQWKQWEKDNHLLVDDLKAQARKIVDSLN